MATEFPKELHYTKTHEWARFENNIITVGITDYAQSQLGDLVYVELPKLNRQVKKNDDVAVVESVKTAADIYSPVNGEIIEINQMLSATPDKINKDPYGEGWIFRIRVQDKNEWENLWSAEKYESEIGD